MLVALTVVMEKTPNAVLTVVEAMETPNALLEKLGTRAIAALRLPTAHPILLGPASLNVRAALA